MVGGAVGTPKNIRSNFFWNDLRLRVFNPWGKPLDQLPIIYGFNNGGSRQRYQAIAISQDGRVLRRQFCSTEACMPRCLSMAEGEGANLESFINYYPEGFRCKFVGLAESDQGLNSAISNHLKFRAGFG